MKPVILIATHNRLEVTKRNIESLLGQSVKPIIVLVCSYYESRHYDEGSDFVHVIEYTDKPLGSKWQHGVNEIGVFFNERSLILTGSDDILCDGFIENACRLVEQGNHFIGLRQWYQHKDGKAYKCQYMAKNNFPLGGGRVYSAEMLKAINYQVFDPAKDRHLDDLGWANAKKTGLKCLVLDDPEKEGLSIHAIKGDWEVMNQFTVKHPNIKLLSTDKSENVLPSFFK